MANKVVREELSNFLEQNGCQTTSQVMATLEPLFKMLEDGKFVPTKGQIDADSISTAITTILGLSEPAKVALLSLKEVMEEKRWEYKRVWEHDFLDKLWDTYKVVVRNTILGEKVWHGLGDSLLYDTIRPIDNRWDRDQDNILSKILRIGGKYIISNSCFFFIAFSLVNNQEQAKKFLPLISFINQGVLILGGTEDVPDIYLALKW